MGSEGRHNCLGYKYLGIIHLCKSFNSMKYADMNISAHMCTEHGNGYFRALEGAKETKLWETYQK